MFEVNETVMELEQSTGSEPRSEVEDRLAQIAQEIAARMQSNEAATTTNENFACPVDPAERALCEGCQ